MQLISYLTSSISLADGINFFQKIWFTITMLIEGLVFFLVSYSYKLFSLMCSLNLNSLYAVIAPLVDRLKAVVMVFIVFKLGMKLINYLLDPDKAPKGGKSLVINIAISAMFLVSYEFIFGFFNEISMLVMGVPEGYSFTILNQFVDIEDGEDEGLIMRYVFGDTSDVDVGDYIAYETLSMFVRDSQGDSGQLMKALTSTKNNTTVRDGSYNFMNLNAVVPYINKTIEYTWFIPLVMGAYLIWQIVTNSIQIGVRMFKLIILQIIAPIAIIGIIDENGIKSSTFSAYLKTYISTFIGAFTRMATFLVVTVFISKFFLNIDEFLGQASGDGGITKILILCLVIVSGYKFAGDIPKFLSEALGSRYDFGETNISSFGKSVGKIMGLGAGVAGAAIGGAIGLGTGIAAGASAGSGFMGTATNALTGAWHGGVSGYKGKTVADKIKSVGTTSKGNFERGTKIASAGGFGAYVGSNLRNATGTNLGRANQIGKDIKDNEKVIDKANQSNANLDLIESRIAENMKHDASTFNYAGSNEAIEFGTSAEEFSQRVADNDMELRELQKTMDIVDKAANNEGVDLRANREYREQLQQEYDSKRRKIESRATTAFEARQDADTAANGTTVASRNTDRKANNENIRVANEHKRNLEDTKGDLEKGKRVTNKDYKATRTNNKA